MENKKKPKIIYGILSGIIVLLLVIVSVLVVTVYKDKNSVSVADSAPTPLSSSAAITEQPDTAAEGGMYAEQTEPTEKPIDIYYVENNFDVAASDIKPTVSEEGWYIENIGCLEGVQADGFVFDEEKIKTFENGVFNCMRDLGYTSENTNISKMTIDTRTVYPKGDYGTNELIISFNVGSGYGLLVDIDELGYVSCQATGIEIQPTIHDNKDYIINLQHLRYAEDFKWSDKEIKNFENALYQFIDEENINLGMAVINPWILNYNDEEKCYSIHIENYTSEKKNMSVKYYKNSNKYIFERW